MGVEGPLARGAWIAGRYEVVRAIGRGAMGHVYHVMDRDLDEAVALKLIVPPPGEDWDPRREVRLARRVTHPNVARTYDLGRHEHARFITMELVGGESLHQHLRVGRQLPLPEALRIASHLAQGIVAAHAAGVVHRDLKPSNVMLHRERVVITDFGVALALHEGGRRVSLVGTPGYMAPEQIVGGAVDGRADVYALGVVLFRMLAGRMPFPGDPETQVAAQLEGAFPDLRAVLPTIPSAIAEIVRDAVAKDRAERLDATTFMQRLESVRGDVGELRAHGAFAATGSVPTMQVATESVPATTVDSVDSGPPPGPARELFDRARRSLMAMPGPAVAEAVALLEEAHALAPDDASILSALGVGLARLGMALGVQSALARAEELSIRAVLADPTSAETLCTLGFLRAQQGELRSAVRIFRAALGRDPETPVAHVYLAELLSEAKRAEADQHFDALAGGPFAPRAKAMRARLTALAGDHEEALAVLATTAPLDGGASLLMRRRIALWGDDPVMLARTRAEVEKAFSRMALDPPYPAIFAVGVAGEAIESIDVTAEIEASSLPPRQRTWCHQLATEIYARSGMRDAALDGLLVAASLALTDLLWLDRCPRLAMLRDDPRFAQARALTSSRVLTYA